MGKKKGHDAHLCALVGCEDIKDIAALVAKPEYICVRCGRAANKKKSLCKAQKLSKLLQSKLVQIED